MAKKKKHTFALGLTALAAAAAGAYFLYGKDAEQHRKKAKTKVKSWMLKAKGEVLEQLEKAQTLSEKQYQDVLEKVEGKYRAVQSIDKKELKAVFDDLRRHWVRIKKQVEAVERKQAQKELE